MMQQAPLYAFNGDNGIQKVPTRVSEVVDVNRSLWKIIATIAGGVLFAALAGYFLSISSFWFGLASLTLFLMFLVFQGMFLKEWSQITPGIFFQSATCVGFLFPLIGMRYVSICFLSVFVMILMGTMVARQMLDESMKISFWKTAKLIVSYSFIGMVIAFSIAVVAPFMERGTFMSEDTFAAIMRSNDSVTALFLPGFSSDMTVRSALSLMVEQNLNGSSDSVAGKKILDLMSATLPSTIDIKMLPKATRDKLVKDTISGIVAGLEKQMGESLDLDASVSANIYTKYLMPHVAELTSSQRNYIGLGVVLTILLTVKSVEFILYIPLLIFIYFMYELLLLTKFVSLKQETRPREVLILE
jgi:hypothetical protein